MACSDDNAPETPKPETPDTPEVSVEKSVTINLGEKYQIMEGFGASDCWTPAYVGKYWTSGRDKISELLFLQRYKTDNLRESACQCGVLTWEVVRWKG